MKKLRVRIVDSLQDREVDRDYIIDLLGIGWIDDEKFRRQFEIDHGCFDWNSLVLSPECWIDLTMYRSLSSIPRTSEASDEEIAGWAEGLKELDNFNFDESRKKVKFVKNKWVGDELFEEEYDPMSGAYTEDECSWFV